MKTYDFLAGITVPLGMIFVMTPPTVSIPRVNGVTSIKRISLVSSDYSPPKIPPCTAAPYATASSGLIPLFGSFPLKKSFINYWTFGILVDPPTNTISSISLFFIPASSRTYWTGLRVFLNKSAQSSSNLALVIVSSKSIPSIIPSIVTLT